MAFQILGYGVAVAGGCWVLFRKEKLRFSLKKRVLKSLLGYGWKTQLATVTYYINQRVDQLLLSLLVGPRELGLYVVAVTVSLALGFLPQASAIVTLAAGSNLPREGAKAFIGRLLSHFSALAAGGLLGAVCRRALADHVGLWVASLAVLPSPVESSSRGASP